MQPDLDVLDRLERPEHDDGVADLARDGVIDALGLPALGDVRAIRVAEQDADPDAGLRLVGEQLLESGVLGHERGRVDEDADLALGLLEQMPPDVPRHGPAVRVDGDDLALGRRGDLVTVERIRPDVGLVHAEEGGDLEPVPAVRDAALDDPPLHGLGVYLRDFGELVGSYPPLQQERSQPLVRHSTHARRT